MAPWGYQTHLTRPPPRFVLLEELKAPRETLQGSDTSPEAPGPGAEGPPATPHSPLARGRSLLSPAPCPLQGEPRGAPVGTTSPSGYPPDQAQCLPGGDTHPGPLKRGWSSESLEDSSLPAQGVGAEGFFTLADVPSSRGRLGPHSASNSQIRGPCPHPNRKTKTSPRVPGSESLRNGGLSGMRPQRQRPQHPLAGGLGRAGPSGLSVLISCRGSVSGQAGCEDRMAAPGKARRPAGLMLSPRTQGPGSQATGLWVVQDSN